MLPILIIDDDKQVRAVLRVMLEEVGHRVLEACNGAQGVKMLHEHPVAMVFSDVFMPDQDGLETIMRLRRELVAVPIIAMSGGGFQGTVDCLPIAKKLGASATLSKPFDMQALREVVREVQANRHSGRLGS